MIIRCKYCGLFGGEHGPSCPESNPAQRTALKEQWAQGYRDGKARKAEVFQNPTYHLGWAQGNIAADDEESGLCRL
jgi:hypothetical protein